MEVIIKPEQKNLDDYINKGINNFLLPLDDYSVEYNSSFSLEEIKKIINSYKNINLFISINKNIFNNEIKPLENILSSLDKLNIKGIFYYDLAVLNLVKKLNLKINLVWNQTHMVTNYKTCDYYYDNGVKYALISKEITIDEIVEILNKSKITPIVELITYPSVAFSKRKLITNYYKDLNKNVKNSLLIKEKLSDDNYKLIENNSGTSFFKDSLVNGSSILEKLLDNNLKYILLNEDFIDHNIFLKTLNNIDYYINNYKNMTKEDKNNWQIEQKKLLGNNTGFFFKKTIYKVK